MKTLASMQQDMHGGLVQTLHENSRPGWKGQPAWKGGGRKGQGKGQGKGKGKSQRKRKGAPRPGARGNAIGGKFKSAYTRVKVKSANARSATTAKMEEDAKKEKDEEEKKRKEKEAEEAIKEWSDANLSCCRPRFLAASLFAFHGVAQTVPKLDACTTAPGRASTGLFDLLSQPAHIARRAGDLATGWRPLATWRPAGDLATWRPGDYWRPAGD